MNSTTALGRTGLLGLAVCAVATLPACAPGRAKACDGRLPGDLVITEYMSNPDGTDSTKEYVELYNASGADIDLKGFTISVSKPDGSGEKTHVFASGKVPAGGFFVVGDADPTALPTWEGYSYGGSLDLPNTGGLIGLRCGPTTIDEAKYEVASPSGTARIFSGDLSPDAAANDDANNWCDAKTEFATNAFGSPGTTNAICARAGSCRDPITGTPRSVVTPTSDDLVITEVMGNPVGTDSGKEWIEVLAVNDFDLNGLQLVNNSGTKGAIDVPADGSCVHVAAGTYALLANGADTATNGGLPAVTATFSAPAMVTGTSVNVSLQTATGAIIDQATYAASGEGPSAQLDPGNLASQLNDVTSVWCPGTSAYGSEGNKGTPGAANVPCPGGNTGGTTCTDGSGSRAIISPAIGDLVISEWMADPNAVTDANGEWVEVYALKAVDLNGVYLKSGTTKGPVVSDPACVHLDAGQYGVFAKQTDPAVNGGIANARSLGSVALTNTTADDIEIFLGTTELDRVTYATAASGISTQLSSAKLLAAPPHPAGDFCPATSTYGTAGTDKGTPGAANVACP